MREQKQVYDQIRKNYPENISKEQFYKIAHISKATALYLLDSGKVPCIRSSKNTHRYIIRTDDVIEYMIDRERNPCKYIVPDGWYRGHSEAECGTQTFQSKLAELVPEQSDGLPTYMNARAEDCNALLNVADVSVITGYSSTTIRRWCRKGGLKAFRTSRGLLIPKQHLIDFLSSEYACVVTRKSKKHLKTIIGFLKTQNKG